MKKQENKEEFWVSNISDRNVSLSDLGLTIKTLHTVNLLDSRHYYLTKEQLLKSQECGSLFKKKDKVVVRKVPPALRKPHLVTIDLNAIVPSKQRSSIVILEKKYEELNITDEEFASENAESALVDHAPTIKTK